MNYKPNFLQRRFHRWALNPEKESRKIKFQLIRYTLIIILISCFLSFLSFSYLISNDPKKFIYKQKELLEKNLFLSLASFHADSIINSKEYKIDKIADIAGIIVPKDIPEDHLDLMITTAKYYDIPLRIFFRVVYKESNFNPNAISPKNAKGYFQIMDATFDFYKNDVRMKKLTAENNIRMAGFILYDLKQRYKSWDLTLAAYNAGPGVVDKCHCVPNYPETKQYVKFILE